MNGSWFEAAGDVGQSNLLLSGGCGRSSPPYFTPRKWQVEEEASAVRRLITQPPATHHVT